MMRATLLLAAGLAVAGCQKDAPASQPAAEMNAETTKAATTANQSQLSQTVLQIEGMVCQGCAEAAKGCLAGIDGVADADVSMDDRSARVHYDATKTSPPAMVAALEAVDRGEAPAFQASVRNSGE